MEVTPWGYNGLGEIVYLRTYSRWLEDDGRSERWPETIDRVVKGIRNINAQLTESEEDRLADHMLSLRGTVSGRALWMLGTKMVDIAHQDALNNCYMSTVTKADDFRWIMDRLMVGGGVGFSVERSDVYQLPTVQKASIRHERSADADHIVSDTRTGWSTLIDHLVKAHFKGEDFSYSTLLVRGYGAPLKTFGGTASGPQALIDGVADICKVMCNRAGKKLRSVDVLDIVNIIGRVVVAGSSRRSAQISLGDQDDTLFLKAKKWSSGSIPAWRANSNNTIIVDNFSELRDNNLFWDNFNGGSEVYGLFNRKLSRNVGRAGEKNLDSSIVGGNPCLEIPLGNKESCNLSTIWLPNVEKFEDFLDLSSILYKVQKATALLEHPSKESNTIIHKNLRLGQSIAGILQATDEQRAWLSPAYEALRELDSEWSKKLGVRESVRLTTIQPNGTLGLVGGTTPGIHPAYDRFYIRRVRFGSNDPLVPICKDKGYPVLPEVGLDGKVDHTRLVVEFPCEAPENTPLASTTTAEEQLEWVAWAQENWADNAVSVTVTYKDNELPSIKQWLSENYDTRIKSVSFLRYSDHGFALAPYEPVTKEEYDKRLLRINKETITLKGQSELDSSDCDTGICPVR